GVHADQLVTGDHGPDVREPLVTMDHPAVVETERRIVDDLPTGGHAEHHGKGGRREYVAVPPGLRRRHVVVDGIGRGDSCGELPDLFSADLIRSEEHTSELQSRENLVCRLMPEKKK